MKRSLTLFTVALVLTLSASLAHAAQWMVQANGGASIPTGDFADKNKNDAGTGALVGGAVSYLVNERFAVGVDGSWTRNKHGIEGTTEDLGGGLTVNYDKDRFQQWQVGAHGKYLMPVSGRIHPFGLVGVGFYNVKEVYEYKYSDGTSQTDESDNVEQPGSRFGGKVGLGAMLDATPQVSVGVQGEYNFVSMDKDKFGLSSLQFIGVRGLVAFNIMK